ncbi:hypothetical protein DPMN_118036 [Dreissena polymorpha]|uniref:Uncharacterized protein n=1 Tax=Dreissena polymorpha TaxID=45954 RepID=A0A9D4GG07_DREPO|nr:hypothetical protein DPMN_118036 [Dreissena polymorpha]
MMPCQNLTASNQDRQIKVLAKTVLKTKSFNQWQADKIFEYFLLDTLDMGKALLGTHCLAGKNLDRACFMDPLQKPVT